MNNTFLILSIIIPVLLIAVGYLGYNYYLTVNKQKKIIDHLTDDNRIIDSKKRKESTLKEERNWLRKNLAYAGFSQQYVEFYFIIISFVFGFLSSSFVGFVTSTKIVLISTFLLSSLFPLLILRKIISSRREEFNFGLKIIIDKVTSMMKSGVGFEQSLKKSVLTSKSKFTQEVFNIYLTEKDIIGEEKCFKKMFNIVESKELRIFYLVISIGKQSGGKFSNTLETLRKTLHDQEEIKQQITSSTQEIRIGSYMIIALVVFIFIMLNESMNGVIYEHFFYSNEGNIQIFFIGVWIAFGLFINSIMTKVKG